MIRIIVMLCVCLLGLPAMAAETPDAALAGLQQAIDTKDAGLLEKYIDVRGVIAKGVDAFIADFAKHPPSGEGDPLLEMLSGGLAAESGQAVANPMKELLVEETRKFVLWGVASGNFSGSPSLRQPVQDGGLLSSLFADASIARKELRSIRCAAPKGDLATASAKLYDHGSERSYPVQVRLKRQPEGHWKVTEVSNIRDLITTVRKEAEAR
ncbi:MAG: hypothetical protein EOL86_07085 [Deltaproteobacteria bacterium]|nr:hypothetical protein [Deltaproteobacteria bacterium]